MRLHLLGIPHTQTTYEFSHCAFTGKVKRFAPMMQSVGYDVIHYGVEGAHSGATYDVNLMSVDEKILELINRKILIPIVDDFLLFHKDNETYEKGTTENKHRKEDTKIKYIINIIDWMRV